MKNDTVEPRNSWATLRHEPYKQMLTQLQAQRWYVCCVAMFDVVNSEVITHGRDRIIIFVQWNWCLTFVSTHLETILQGKK